jgi:hypothetical protein
MSLSHSTKVAGNSGIKERQASTRAISISTTSGQDMNHVIRFQAIRKKIISQRKEIGNLDRIPKRFKKLSLAVVDKLEKDVADDENAIMKEFVEENPDFIDKLRLTITVMCTRWEKTIKKETGLYLLAVQIVQW